MALQDIVERKKKRRIRDKDTGLFVSPNSLPKEDVLYRRKSLEKLKLENQELEFVTRFPHLAGIRRVEETVEGDGDRVELYNLLETLGPGSTIYAASVDRLSRCTQDLLKIAEICEVRGINLVTMRQGDLLKLDRPYLIMLGMIAEMEKANTAERTKWGIASKREATKDDPERLGLWGYALAKHKASLTGKKLKTGGKEVNKVYIKALPDIRRLRAKKFTMREIAAMMTQQYKIEFSAPNICRLLMYGHG